MQSPFIFAKTIGDYMNVARYIGDEVLLFMILIALYVSLRHGWKQEVLLIQIYIIATLLNSTAYQLRHFFPKQHLFADNSATIDNIHSVIEIFTFNIFLFIRMPGKKIRMIIIFLLLVSISLSGIQWKTTGIDSFLPELTGFQKLLITIPCLFFVYQILRSDFHIELKNNQDFIIVAGMLVYASISVPLFLFWYDFYVISKGSYNILLLFLDVLYILLFIAFIKAFLTPVPNQTL